MLHLSFATPLPLLLSTNACLLFVFFLITETLSWLCKLDRFPAELLAPLQLIAEVSGWCTSRTFPTKKTSCLPERHTYPILNFSETTKAIFQVGRNAKIFVLIKVREESSYWVQPTITPSFSMTILRYPRVKVKIYRNDQSHLSQSTSPLCANFISPLQQFRKRIYHKNCQVVEKTLSISRVSSPGVNTLTKSQHPFLCNDLKAE